MVAISRQTDQAHVRMYLEWNIGGAYKSHITFENVEQQSYPVYRNMVEQSSECSHVFRSIRFPEGSAIAGHACYQRPTTFERLHVQTPIVAPQAFRIGAPPAEASYQPVQSFPFTVRARIGRNNPGPRFPVTRA